MVSQTFFTLNSILALFFLYTGLYLLNSNVYGFSVYPDTLIRVDPNESLIGSYSFFWTNFSYLPLFYFILALFCGCTFIRRRTSWFSILVTFVTLAYGIELFDLLTLNYNSRTGDFYKPFLNLLLLNYLNKYHPFIFYTSTILFYLNLLILVVSALTPRKPFNQASLFSMWYALLRYTFYIVTFALVLGGWWAFQEGSWGGWWDWDPSEMLGLIFMVNCIALLHTNGLSGSLVQIKLKMQLLTLLTLLCYYTVQLNFEFVSHNFGIKSFFLFNNNLIFLEVLTVVSWCFMALLQSVTSDNSNIKVVLVRNPNRTFVPRYTASLAIYGTGLLFLYFFLSFTPLLNYFNENFWTIDVVTLKSTLQVLNVLVYLLTILQTYSTSIKDWYIFQYWAICLSTPHPLMTLFTKLTCRLLPLLHASLILFFLISLANTNLPLLTNQLLAENTPMVLVNTLSYPYSNLVTCDGFLIEYGNLTLSQSDTIALNWGVNYVTNTQDLSTFLLMTLNSTCFSVSRIDLGWGSLLQVSEFFNTQWLMMILITQTLLLLRYLR